MYTCTTLRGPRSFTAGRPAVILPGTRRSAGDALAEPGKRKWVPVIDPGMRGVEQLKTDDFIGDTGLVQRHPERLRAEVEEEVVPGARVDPDRTQRPQRARVPRCHPDRVPVQPPLPDVGPQHPGAGIERQVDRAVLAGREAGRYPEDHQQVIVGFPGERDPGPEVVPPLPD